MNNKIPCGGFELDDSLTLDSEKKLGVNSKYVPGTSVMVRIYDNHGKLVADKSFDDIRTAMDDGKYVYVYYVDDTEFYQLTDDSSDFIRFARATPYSVSSIDINNLNEVEYLYLSLEGEKNGLLSFDEEGHVTPVDSLDYIKLKSPNGTLYTISVTDNGTIQANAEG